jgi:hypothetical protein
VKVNESTNTVTLERGDVVEVILPGGDSVWVWASGHTMKKPKAKRPGRQAVVRGEDPGSGGFTYPSPEESALDEGFDLPGGYGS